MQIGIVIRRIFESRPDEAELAAIRMMLSLCREYGFRLHIVHLSTSQALQELRAARSEGLRGERGNLPALLASVCRNNCKRGDADANVRRRFAAVKIARGLWEGLRDGTIDMVVTDHSPCPPAMKRLHEGNFRTAWGGIASLSVALPLMWTEASRRGFTLLDLARWMAAAPARLAGCDIAQRSNCRGIRCGFRCVRS